MSGQLLWMFGGLLIGTALGSYLQAWWHRYFMTKVLERHAYMHTCPKGSARIVHANHIRNALEGTP